MKTYREIIHSDWFMPPLEVSDRLEFPVKMRWGGAEDSDGVAIPLHFEAQPHFCEITFADKGNYMIEINGKWFYRSPEAKTIDLMGAFFEKPLDGSCDMTLKIFAPPAEGVNDTTQGDDWAENYYFTMETPPEIRIEYGPVEKEVR